ncbi:MAG: tetratricopeptide repeat protein [Deltaproteobacteria bacterium]|nr:tetratricopeptide repeat protein [Deltaproteobacteria bacterium]
MAETDINNAPPTSPAQAAAPSADEHVLLGQLRRASDLVSAQRLPEAEAELLAARRTSPRDLRVLKLLAVVRFKLGRLVEAGQVYRQAAEVAPEDPAVRLNLGLIALKLESFAEAAQELEAAVRAQPEDRRAWSYLGYAYARSASPAQAASAFRRAGQHELAAEMERAVTPSAHSSELPVVEGGSEEPPAGPAAAVARSAAMATPRPQLRAETTPGLSLTPGAAEAAASPMVTLAAFTTARLLTLAPLSAPLASEGEGLLRFQAGAEAHVRESALLVAFGGPGLSLARRRARGHYAGGNLATETDRFFRLDGGGELLLLSPDRKRRLTALALERDVLYVEEDRVMAWGDEVVWESGRVPGNGKALFQFRGTGRVVIVAGENEIVAIRIAEGECRVVPTARLAGWLGQVVVQGRPATAEKAIPGLEYVTCEGEGVLLLSRHGEPR